MSVLLRRAHELHEKALELDAMAVRVREERDRMIVHALGDGASRRNVAELLGLSYSQIRNIEEASL